MKALGFAPLILVLAASCWAADEKPKTYTSLKAMLADIPRDRLPRSDDAEPTDAQRALVEDWVSKHFVGSTLKDRAVLLEIGPVSKGGEYRAELTYRGQKGKLIALKHSTLNVVSTNVRIDNVPALGSSKLDADKTYSYEGKVKAITLKFRTLGGVDRITLVCDIRIHLEPGLVK